MKTETTTAATQFEYSRSGATDCLHLLTRPVPARTEFVFVQLMDDQDADETRFEHLRA